MTFGTQKEFIGPIGTQKALLEAQLGSNDYIRSELITHWDSLQQTKTKIFTKTN